MNVNISKSKVLFLRITILLCVVSIFAVCMAYYHSGDITQLYKISLPAAIGVLAIINLRRETKSKAYKK